MPFIWPNLPGETASWFGNPRKRLHRKIDASANYSKESIFSKSSILS
jgi:hypothetical protein